MICLATGCQVSNVSLNNTEVYTSGINPEPESIQAAFENRIAIKLMGPVLLEAEEPIPDQETLQTKLTMLDSLLTQLASLNKNLLSLKQQHDIHQVKMLRISYQRELNLWHKSNHLTAIKTLIPQQTFNIQNRESVDLTTRQIQEIPQSLSRLSQILEHQTSLGIIYPDELISYATDHIRNVAVVKPGLLLDRYQQLLTYSDLTIKEQRNQYLLMEQKFEREIRPAYLLLLRYLQDLKQAPGVRETSLVDGPGVIEPYLTGQADILQILHDEQARTYQQITSASAQYSQSPGELYRDPKYTWADQPGSYQTILNLISLYALDIQKDLDNWFRQLPANEVLLAGMDNPDLAHISYSDGQSLFDLQSLTNLPNYELETLAYQYTVPGFHLPGETISAKLQGSKLSRIYLSGWSIYSLNLLWQHRENKALFETGLAELGFLVRSHLAVCSAIIDVNLQIGNWSSDQARDFLSDQTPYSPGFIKRHVLRIIANAGSSVGSYLIARELKVLQQYSVQQLGLSLPVFHQAIINHSPATLKFLKTEMRDILSQ